MSTCISFKKTEKKKGKSLVYFEYQNAMLVLRFYQVTEVQLLACTFFQSTRKRKQKQGPGFLGRGYSLGDSDFFS